jgi:hypothetical protein
MLFTNFAPAVDPLPAPLARLRGGGLGGGGLLIIFVTSLSTCGEKRINHVARADLEKWVGYDFRFWIADFG